VVPKTLSQVVLFRIKVFIYLGGLKKLNISPLKYKLWEDHICFV
jgi:hypothetical protein